jgi:PAS domain S-box-containing protein
MPRDRVPPRLWGRLLGPLPLRQRLYLLVAACVVPFVLAGALHDYSVYQTTRAEAGQRMLERARSLSVAVQRDLQMRIAGLQGLATSPALSTGDLEGFRAQARAFLAIQPSGATLSLVDAAGRVLLSIGNATVPLLPPAGAPPGRAQASRTFGTAQPSVSDYFVDVLSHRPSFSVDVPVIRDGHVIYALSLEPGLDTLQALLGPQDLPAGNIASIVNAAGIILARWPTPAGFVGRLGSADYLRQSASGTSKIIETVSADGVPVLGAFADIKGTDWRAGVAVSKSVLQAEPRRTALIGLGIGLAALVVGLLLARAVARRIAGPIAALQAVAARDITAPPRAEATLGMPEADAVGRVLLERRQWLDLALEAGEIGIFNWNIVSGELEWDARLRRIWGVPAEGPLNIEAFFEGLHPEDRPRLRAILDEAINPAGPGEYAAEFRVVNAATGALYCVAARGRTLFAEDGAQRLLGVAMDITRHREAQAERMRLLDMLDLAAVMVRDFDGTIRFWSRGCEALYGYTSAEAVERRTHDLLRTVWPIPLAELDAILLREGEWSGEVRHIARDGRELVVLARKVLWRGEPGRPPVVMESLADITEQERLRTELRRLSETLERRVAEEVAARQNAQERAAHAERMQALGQLAGGIAHDFNNVLQAINSAAHLLAQRLAADPRQSRLAGVILESVRRGTSVTGRLLALSRRSDLRTEPIDPAGLLHGLCEVLAASLGAKIAIVVRAAPDLPPLLADRGQLETALLNLAVNARDAMPEGGELRLEAACESVEEREAHPGGLAPGRYIRLDVIDTGVGMDAEVLARLGQPFFTTKPRGKGTGLGIAIVRGFAEQSGGGFAVESAPGRGTRVSLWLPLAADAVSGPALAGTRPPPAAPARPAWRVLLAEDEALVREMLLAELTEAGCTVLPARNAEEALALLERGEAVDVLVTDFAMPDMDGIALIRAARQRRPGLPALLITGYAESEAEAMEAEAASVTLLHKPVSGEALLERLMALLSSRAG